MTRTGDPIRLSVIRPLRAGVLLFVIASACASGGGSGDPSPRTSAAQDGQDTAPVPTLVILSPRTGDTVTAPVPIRYRVSGLDVGPGGSYLRLYLGEPGASPMFEFPLMDTSGVVYLKAHPMVSGRKMLAFELSLADHTALQNPEARVTLRNVVVEGDRSAGA